MCKVCDKTYDDNTTELHCCQDVTEIPILPKLERLYCANTKITEIPKIPNCFISDYNCVWLNSSAERINKLVILQKWTRSNINKRTKIIHAAMDTHRDLVYVLNA